MTELDAAREIVAGTLPSPWKLGGMTLWAMRITGTGLSYRSGHDEFVWRDSAIFMAPEFIARCNAGLPVIWDHPETAPSLNSEEFGQRVIGTVMLAYPKEDEIWGVCRIYDDEANRLMTAGQLSTSPAVVFNAGSGNQKVELNGETFLIEGTPSLLDHLAVCSNGVWDKGGDPTGVLNDTLTQESTHVADETEEEKKAREEREDSARKDADRMDRFDAMLTKMDSRMDTMEANDKARKDAEEDRGRRDRHDAARKDRFGHRKDGESRKDWKARHDADEMGMMDMLEKGGVEKDKARKDAKDCRMDAEETERKDGGESFEKWAKEEGDEPEHKDDKARKDAEEKAEKERMEKEEQDRKDRARHDSTTTAELAELRAAIKRLTTEVPAGERDALAAAQSRADSVAAMFGERAPTPMAGEVSLDYRKRLLKTYQKHSPNFKETRFDGIPGEALGGVEETVYNDAVVAAKSPVTARPGLLMEIVRPDAAGRQIKTYVGDPMAWMAPYMSQGASGRIRRNPNSNEGI